MNGWFSWTIGRIAQASIAALFLLSAMASAQQFSVTNWGHKDGLPSTTVYAVTQTTDGYLWLGTGDGLIRFDGFQFVQEELPDADHQPVGQVTALHPTGAAGLLIGTAGGILMKWDGSTMATAVLGSPVERIRGLGDLTIQVETRSKILRLSESDLSLASSVTKNEPQIAGTDSYVRRDGAADENQAAAQRALRSISHESVLRRAVRDRSGALWIATENHGLFRIASDGDAQHFMQSTGLPSDHVWDVFEDREGNLWAGTQNGLARLRQDKFTTYTVHDGLISDIATSLAPAPGGGIWIGSRSGVEHFTGRGNPNQSLLKGVAVDDLLQRTDGTLLIATGNGIHTLSGRETHMLQAIPEMQHIDQIAQSEGGDLWLYGQRSGLWHWDVNSNPEHVNEPALQGQVVTSMQGGEHDQVWLGLANGDVIQRPPVGSHVFTSADGLSGGAIRFLAPPRNGTFWAASDRGLIFFDGEHFRHWNRSSGLPEDRLMWAVADGHGSVWLGYSTGVARLNISDLLQPSLPMQHLHYDFYDDGDGLKSNPEAYGNKPVALTSGGRLWVSMSEGIGVIDPAHVRRNTLAPPVHILELTADRYGMTPANAIRVPARTRNLQISYTGISLTEPRKVRFRYRLEGFEAGWQNAGTRRDAFYTNLRPGHYRFLVLAANNDGLWNETGDSLAFEILPAFYQTAWFLVLCVVVLLSLILMGYRMRMSLAARELQTRYEERMAERTRIAQDLHDNLVQEMMGISLQLEIADEITPSGSNAKGPLRRALDLSRIALDDGRNALHVLRERPFSRADIESTLKDTIQSMTGAPEGVRFTTSGEERLIQPIAGEELLQIVREALRNAIQHAGQSGINVRLKYGELSFSIAVSDQGAGISEDVLGNGKPGHYGIRGMRERAESMGSLLTVNSSQSAGTEWTLTIPAKIAYEVEDPRSRSSLVFRALSRILGRRDR